ncbi:MAG: thymidylate synthase (FAD), partial [Planctomycetaceae bacterium]
FPIVWEAMQDYRIGSLHLTRMDVGVIQRLSEFGAHHHKTAPYSEQDFLAMQDEAWKKLNRSRERDECLEKLRWLGLVER